MLHTCLSAFHFVKLNFKCIEDAADARVIGKHHAAYFVLSRNIWTFLGEGYLDGGWSPRDEVGQFTLSYTLQRLVDLSGIHITLDDVENGNIAAFLHTRVYQDVLWLKQSAHHIQDCCLSHGRINPTVYGQRCIASHQKVTSWGWNK